MTLNYLCDEQDDQSKWASQYGVTGPSNPADGVTAIAGSGFQGAIATIYVAWDQPAASPDDFYAEAKFSLVSGGSGDEWAMFKTDIQATNGYGPQGYADDGKGFAIRETGDWFSFTNTGLTGNHTPAPIDPTSVLLGLHKKSATALDLYIDRVLVGAHPSSANYTGTRTGLWAFNGLTILLDYLAIASDVPAIGEDICTNTTGWTVGARLA